MVDIPRGTRHAQPRLGVVAGNLIGEGANHCELRDRPSALGGVSLGVVSVQRIRVTVDNEHWSAVEHLVATKGFADAGATARDGAVYLGDIRIELVA